MHTSPDVKQSPQYQALEAYTEGHSSLQDSLDAFCGGCESKIRAGATPDSLEEPLWQAWRAVVTKASLTPESSGAREKLVDFVLEVQKRPSPAKDKETCVVQDATIWEDLPVFGMEMREAWNLAATHKSSLDQQDMWVNLNAWTASLVATVHARGQTSPDFSLYGIWTIRAGLEVEGDAPQPALAAAAIWFAHASPTIRELCLAGKAFDGKVAKPGPLYRDCEWRGFSQDRWAVWDRQMGYWSEMARDQKLWEIVSRAMKAMKDVDKASGSGSRV